MYVISIKIITSHNQQTIHLNPTSFFLLYLFFPVRMKSKILQKKTSHTISFLFSSLFCYRFSSMVATMKQFSLLSDFQLAGNQNFDFSDLNFVHFFPHFHRIKQGNFYSKHMLREPQKTMNFSVFQHQGNCEMISQIYSCTLQHTRSHIFTCSLWLYISFFFFTSSFSDSSLLSLCLLCIVNTQNRTNFLRRFAMEKRNEIIFISFATLFSFDFSIHFPHR